jgi:hydrogenase maturation protease
VRFLVAGVGNIFFGDDGFGCAVARELARAPIVQAKVADFGVAGIHLAYELLAGYEHAFIIDAVPRGGAPGTLYVIEPDGRAPAGAPDPHGMDLGHVFAFAYALGGSPPPVTIVGCEPAAIDEGIGLSPPVAAAVEQAAALVRRLLSTRATSARRRDEKRKERV